MPSLIISEVLTVVITRPRLWDRTETGTDITIQTSVENKVLISQQLTCSSTEEEMKL